MVSEEQYAKLREMVYDYCTKQGYTPSALCRSYNRIPNPFPISAKRVYAIYCGRAVSDIVWKKCWRFFFPLPMHPLVAKENERRKKIAIKLQALLIADAQRKGLDIRSYQYNADLNPYPIGSTSIIRAFYGHVLSEKITLKLTKHLYEENKGESQSDLH